MHDDILARRRQLGGFLRMRRLMLIPTPTERAQTGRRRTPGLRREEVAHRAGLSADWIARLEQGRDVRLSVASARRLARALELTPIQTEHLFALSIPYLPAAPTAVKVPESFEAIVTAQGANPAYVHDPGYDVLLRNRAADELFEGFGERQLGRANLLLYMFLHPAAHILQEREHHIRRMVAQFRLFHDRMGASRKLAELSTELQACSPEFRSLWEYHEVLPCGVGVKRFDHPQRGPLTFTYASLQAAEAPGLFLALYIAMPEQPAAG